MAAFCIGYLPPVLVGVPGARRYPCRFAFDGSSNPAEPFRGGATCIWCCGDAAAITDFYSTADGLRAMRRDFRVFPHTVRQIAKERVAGIPLVAYSLRLGRGGVCCGTIDGQQCEFSRRTPGNPVSNTGLRCIWCRPDLARSLRRNSTRQKLRKAYNGLQRQYQILLRERLPPEERRKWVAYPAPNPEGLGPDSQYTDFSFGAIPPPLQPSPIAPSPTSPPNLVGLRDNAPAAPIAPTPGRQSVASSSASRSILRGSQSTADPSPRPVHPHSASRTSLEPSDAFLGLSTSESLSPTLPVPVSLRARPKMEASESVSDGNAQPAIRYGAGPNNSSASETAASTSSSSGSASAVLDRGAERMKLEKKEEPQSPQNRPAGPRATQQKSRTPDSPRTGAHARAKSRCESPQSENDANNDEGSNAGDDADCNGGSSDDADRDWQGEDAVGVCEAEVGVREDEVGVCEDEVGIREDEVGVREDGGEKRTSRAYEAGNRGRGAAAARAPPAVTPVWRWASSKSPARAEVCELLAGSPATDSDATEEAETQRIERTGPSGDPALRNVTATESGQRVRLEDAQRQRRPRAGTNSGDSKDDREKDEEDEEGEEDDVDEQNDDEGEAVPQEQDKELDAEDDEYRDRNELEREEEEEEEEAAEGQAEDGEFGFPGTPPDASSSPLPTQFDYEEWLRSRWSLPIPAKTKCSHGRTTQKEQARKQRRTEADASSSTLLAATPPPGQSMWPPSAPTPLAPRDAATSSSHAPVLQKRPAAKALYDASAPSGGPVSNETRKSKRRRSQ